VDFKLRFYSQLLDYSDALHKAGEKLIICGDFNTAHNDIDLRSPSRIRTPAFYRKNVGLQYCHTDVDIYRQLYPERVEYTWWTYLMNARKNNVGWRLDYFLISEGLVSQVKDVVIKGDVLGSDHCPVTLDITD
jgi:exodeoxyribonuclease-3